MQIFCLNFLSPIYLISTFPIINFVSSNYSTSVIRNKTYIIEDLPDPVLPTKAIFLPPSIEKFRLFKAKLESDRYFILTFSNCIEPLAGKSI